MLFPGEKSVKGNENSKIFISKDFLLIYLGKVYIHYPLVIGQQCDRMDSIVW